MRGTVRRMIASGDDGFSIVEVLMASVILAVGLMALASTAIPSVRALHVAEGRQAATAAVTRNLELARQMPYKDLAMISGSFTAGTYDPDGSGPLGVESLVRDTTGKITRTLPFWGVTSDQIDLETNVTLWCDNVSPCATVGAEAGRRVSVTATWKTGSGTHSTRTNTIIARADR